MVEGVDYKFTYNLKVVLDNTTVTEIVRFK